MKKSDNPKPAPSCCDYSFGLTLCNGGVIIDYGNGNQDVAGYVETNYGGKSDSNIKLAIGGILLCLMQQLDNSPKTIEVKIYPTEQNKQKS